MKRMNAVQQSAVVSAVLLLVLFLFPLLAIRPAEPGEKEEPATAEPPTEAQPFTGGELDAKTVLRVLDGEQVRQMELGAYLVGVVRAEMPASFAVEALKAQAVAARTYTLYQMLAGGNHGDCADICTDSTCCQAYKDEAAARADWGAEAELYEKKVEQAVAATDGETILYGGVPILAVFHACSAGLTRPAGEVWQSDLPYLQSVTSPEPEERIANYFSRAEFSRGELKEKLQAAFPNADLSGAVSSWLRGAVTDPAGSVQEIQVGGVRVKGSALRNALGLRSACFEWEVQENGSVVFFVTGYGHGVGLSQHGADRMAEEGADYREILTHYYTGVTVEPYGGE